MGALIILLFAGHALCDYPLQGDFLSRGKNPANHVGVPWYWCLSAHALIHAGMVLLVTRYISLALGEFVIHSVTDYSKVKGWISCDTDQYIHFGCKLVWALLAVWWMR